MEKDIEIGSLPDRDGFAVFTNGENVFIEQYSGDDTETPIDVVKVHVSDVYALIGLLADAAEEVEAQAEAEEQTAAETCNTLGPHNPDGSCCATK